MKKTSTTKSKSKTVQTKFVDYDCAWCDDCCVPPSDVQEKDGVLYHKKCGKEVEKN